MSESPPGGNARPAGCPLRAAQGKGKGKMSSESMEWLNGGNIVVGYTAPEYGRGKPWWYRENLVADGVIWPDAVPRDVITGTLFDWVPAEGTFETTWTDEAGQTRHTTAPDRKVIIHPRTGKVIAAFKDGYKVHGYQEWLLNNLELLLDSGELGIGSAGLLAGGGQAWLQAELPETISTPEGADFRPHIAAIGSCDGSLSSTYITGATLIVCDNTMAAGLATADNKVKIRHSSRSLGKKATAVRDALGIVHDAADAFMAELAELTRIDVSDAAWDKFLAAHAGDLHDKKGRALTLAEKKRDALTQAYRNDKRNPWTGTAFGVVQAVSLYEQHAKTVKGASRPERNAGNAIRGDYDKLDKATMSTLRKVLATA